MLWSNGSRSQKALFPSQFCCCGFQLGNLVLEETVTTVISSEHSRKYGLQMCSEGSQATSGIHHLGQWISLSLQSQRPDAQDSLCIVFSACALSDGQPYWTLCSKHSARVHSCQFYYKLTFLHVRTISDQKCSFSCVLDPLRAPVNTLHF